MINEKYDINHPKFDKEMSLKMKAYSKKLIKEGDIAAHRHKINGFCQELAHKTRINLLYLFGNIDARQKEEYLETWHSIIIEIDQIIQRERKKNEDTIVS